MRATGVNVPLPAIIRNLVEQISEVLDDEEGATDAAGKLHYTNEIWAELALKTYRNRRLRTKIFQNEGLFGEPAWDLLLDLFVRQMQGLKTSVTSACIAACVPPTTGLRWIRVLEAENLIERFDDPEDARRHFLRLTHKGIDGMKQYVLATSHKPRMKL